MPRVPVYVKVQLEADLRFDFSLPVKFLIDFFTC
jgi:hypothetical protein